MLVKVTSGAIDTYPYSAGKLRRDNPNISFPKQIPDEMLASFGVYNVATASKPSYNERTQKVTRSDRPSLVDGSWVLGWSVTEKTSSEIQEYDNAATADSRAKRNQLLSETDFHALADATLSSEMAEYRQALRDITSHANWPYLENSDWPSKP